MAKSAIINHKMLSEMILFLDHVAVTIFFNLIVITLILVTNFLIINSHLEVFITQLKDFNL